MGNYEISNLEKLDGCLIICWADKEPYIIEVPGYEFTATETDSGHEEPLWVVKNCGMWSVISPYYGLEMGDVYFRTRKAAIENFKNHDAARYFKFLRERRGMLVTGRDPLENEYRRLADDFRQGRR